MINQSFSNLYYFRLIKILTMEEFVIDDEYKIVKEKETGFWNYSQNGELMPKRMDKVFKFYSLTINNIGALLNSYFYLSNPISFNDPFDCNFNLIDDPKIYDAISNMKSVKRNDYKNIGVVSMTEVVDNPIMWAHYTNNYRGFAIEFKGTEVTIIPHDDTPKGTFVKVIYPKELKKVPVNHPFAMQYMLTTKLKNWEYEKEWRYITQLGSKLNRILHYDPKKLKGLYIGHQLVDEDPSGYQLILKIRELVFPNTPVYVVYPHSNELRLHFEKVL